MNVFAFLYPQMDGIPQRVIEGGAAMSYGWRGQFRQKNLEIPVFLLVWR